MPLPSLTKAAAILASAALCLFVLISSSASAHAPASKLLADEVAGEQGFGMGPPVTCHEWVRIKDGTVEYVKLRGDLSATDGEPDDGHPILFKRFDGQL